MPTVYLVYFEEGTLLKKELIVSLLQPVLIVPAKFLILLKLIQNRLSEKFTRPSKKKYV